MTDFQVFDGSFIVILCCSAFTLWIENHWYKRGTIQEFIKGNY